ncbi:guanylate kinase [candidate division LCP-89 bacterium B3_LCP]|uniref:Guanylate kinase n=1 Tax=candidate division LCP-89 bacterium B3_LCP TaxID=2012998 RepID=A0A532V0M9_UNCL8|nr:MAG: guanylate kinase [candidate division LCP-89 bacterium B3_LCP]
MNRGRFIVLSSPSGCGKTTIIERLLRRNNDFVYSLSATTRPPREDEKNGIDYWFLTEDEFLQKRDNGDLLEWEEVYQCFYGTPKEPAEEAVSGGFQVIFDLDTVGALKLKKKYPEALLIFILPPSMEVLGRRLRERRSESERQLQIRLTEAKRECEQADKFDYKIINDDLEEAVIAIERIIRNTIAGR